MEAVTHRAIIDVLIGTSSSWRARVGSDEPAPHPIPRGGRLLLVLRRLAEREHHPVARALRNLAGAHRLARPGARASLRAPAAAIPAAARAHGRAVAASAPGAARRRGLIDHRVGGA